MCLHVHKLLMQIYTSLTIIDGVLGAALKITGLWCDQKTQRWRSDQRDNLVHFHKASRSSKLLFAFENFSYGWRTRRYKCHQEHTSRQTSLASGKVMKIWSSSSKAILQFLNLQASPIPNLDKLSQARPWAWATWAMAQGNRFTRGFILRPKCICSSIEFIRNWTYMWEREPLGNTYNVNMVSKMKIKLSGISVMKKTRRP